MFAFVSQCHFGFFIMQDCHKKCIQMFYRSLLVQKQLRKLYLVIRSKLWTSSLEVNNTLQKKTALGLFPR